MTSGKIKALRDGYGFITADDGTEYFFHRTDLIAPTRFDDLNEGDAVEFEPVVPAPAKGKRASDVRPTSSIGGS
jgi:cold shock CspA family protein